MKELFPGARPFSELTRAERMLLWVVGGLIFLLLVPYVSFSSPSNNYEIDAELADSQPTYNDDQLAEKSPSIADLEDIDKLLKADGKD